MVRLLTAAEISGCVLANGLGYKCAVAGFISENLKQNKIGALVISDRPIYMQCTF
jgi:primosomal replication protein N